MPVQFEDNQYKINARMYPQYEGSKQPPLVSFLLKMGIAKSERQANYVLIVIFLICTTVTVTLILSQGGDEVAMDIDPRTGQPVDYFAQNLQQR